MQIFGFLVALTGYCISSILFFEAGQKQDSARSVCGILPLSVSPTPGPGVCLDLRAKAAVSPAGHSALKRWRLGNGELLTLFLSGLTVSCSSMLFYIMSFSLELPALWISDPSTRHRGNSFRNF